MHEDDTGMSMTKTCSTCDHDQPLACYTKNSKSRDGLEARCITCRAHARRLSAYDLTAQAYLALGESQGWCCAICGRSQDELTRSLVVDHAHDTGTVRGLLCHACNIGIGHFADNVNNIRHAADYVQVWKEHDESNA